MTVGEPAVAHARAGDLVVHSERGSDKPSLLRLRTPTAERRDSDHPLDAVLFECLAGRTGEAHVSGFDALRFGIGGSEPEHRVGACKRPSDDIGVAV